MLNGKRVVYDDGMTDEGFDALGRLNEEVYYYYSVDFIVIEYGYFNTNYGKFR